MSYIKSSDIKAKIAEGCQLQDYILEADEAINDLAQTLGVRDTSYIESNPLHYKVKRYGVVFILMRLCQDRIGTNDPTYDTPDKYQTSYDIYKREFVGLQDEINIEIMTGNVNSLADRSVGTGFLYFT